VEFREKEVGKLPSVQIYIERDLRLYYKRI